MASLTPKSRSDEVTGQAMKEGLINGTMVFVPSLGALYAAMRNPKFRKFTNWQSRTSMVIMPALFMFALTAENKLIHRMEEVADETDHAIHAVEWAERRLQSTKEDIKFHDLYRQSILDSHVQLVDGELGFHHKAANFVQANPFKCIAGIGVPAVAWIFAGEYGKPHVNMQLKILHTRVFGQFAVICTLLGVMGMKEMMDHSGRFITESEIEARVQEMQATRASMMARLDHQVATMNKNMPSKKKRHEKTEETTASDHAVAH